jgi:sugar phosphate permease
MIEQAPSSRHANAVLAIIVASYLMIVADISIVITGLPKIQASLGFTAAQLSWVQNAYTLSFGGWLLLGARAGDLLGRRRLFIAGLSIFTTASVVIGLAPSAGLLPAARAVQGFGAAMAIPRLTRRYDSSALLLVGLSLAAIGMGWLGRADASAAYWLDIAPPMVLIGLGQGLLLAPLTSAGVAGVSPQDAGAASGLVDVAHQLGGSLGLGLLVVVFTAASDDPGLSEAILAHRISAVLDAGALLMLLALAVSWFCIARPQRVARLAAPPTSPLKDRS